MGSSNKIQLNIIDGLRGIAQIIVSSIHMKSFFGIIPQKGGEIAVDFFLILSGFFMSYGVQTYIKEKYQVQFVVKSLKVNYIYSSKLDDQINLVTDLESINRAKLCFRHIFYKEKKEISKIQVTVCCISNTGRVARMPKSLYHKFIN